MTGRPEDVADQMPVFLAVMTDLGDDIAFAGAQYFARAARGSRITAANMADEHSLDEQRAYNILCWMYGADPRSHQDLVRLGALPEDRARRCPQEFDSFGRAFREKLLPHVQK